MLKWSIGIVMMLLVHTGFAQTSAWKQFWKLPFAEKRWVVFHPFKAKRAQQISNRVKMVVDSMKHTNALDANPYGGQLDAFRHAYWMMKLAQEIGPGAAYRLGRAHEKGNKQLLRKGTYNKDNPPDRASREMDLYNNRQAIAAYKNAKKDLSDSGLRRMIIIAIGKGEYRVVRKNDEGQSLDEHGFVILEWQGRWENGRVTVSSNR